MQTLESPPWLRMLRSFWGTIRSSVLVYFSIYWSCNIDHYFDSSVVLLVVGIERISVGAAMPSCSRRLRLANLGIGLLIIAFSICAYAIPSIYISGFSCSGCNRLTRKRYIKNNTRYITQTSGSSRAFRIGVGVLSIAVSILVIAQPIYLGLVLFAIMISIAFLISGIEMMALGISGRERSTIRSISR